MTDNPTPIIGGAVSATGNQGSVPSPAENAATVQDAHDTLIEACWSPDDVAEWLAALAALLAQAEAGDERWAAARLMGDKWMERAEAAEAERDAAVRERDRAQQALRAIRALPSEHDLMHNAIAKAVWTIADAALTGEGTE